MGWLKLRLPNGQEADFNEQNIERIQPSGAGGCLVFKVSGGYEQVVDTIDEIRAQRSDALEALVEAISDEIVQAAEMPDEPPVDEPPVEDGEGEPPADEPPQPETPKAKPAPAENKGVNRKKKA